jgi:hypothetical protein
MSIEFNSEKKEKHILTLKQRQIELDAGILGRLFGNAKNAPTNIGGMVLCILLVVQSVLCFVSGSIPSHDYLQLVLPVITTILGYFFGVSKCAH